MGATEPQKPTEMIYWYFFVCSITFTCMNWVPKSASVVTPPVKTLLTNFGALSLMSVTCTITFKRVSSEALKMFWLAGVALQFSVAWIISSCPFCDSLSKILTACKIRDPIEFQSWIVRIQMLQQFISSLINEWKTFWYSFDQNDENCLVHARYVHLGFTLLPRN